MNKFLYQVAQDLYTKYDSFENMVVVFPNKRAALFFNKYLQQISDKVLWAPQYLTINQLFTDISGIQVADNLMLNSILFNEYKRISKSAENFDEFFYWGEIIISDFDDIDKYLVDARDLFRNVKELQEYKRLFNYLTDEQVEAIQSFWSSFTPENYSKHQDEFLRIWEVLFDVYTAFKEKLRAEKIGYEGMVFREVVENLKSVKADNFAYDKYIFVGFNALNECEKALFSHLQHTKRADFYWDYDQFYVENKFQEAGFFVRENIRQFPMSSTSIETNNLKQQKHIEVINTGSNLSQVKLVPGLLQKYMGENDLPSEETAVVLADEDLIVPLLYSLPENKTGYNLTLGYEISNSRVFAFVQSYLALYRMMQKRPDSYRLYFKDLLQFARNEYVHSGNEKEIEAFVQQLEQSNRAYVYKKELEQIQWFSRWFGDDSNERISSRLLQWVGEFVEKTASTDQFESDFLIKVSDVLRKLDSTIQKLDIKLSVEIESRVIINTLRTQRIPFEGEPLRGIQIMGILETRGLDFKNLILLSLNEGVLPKTAASASFIPYNLRKGFGLLTIEHQDSIFAYYFYRLVQRAENIHLMYYSGVSKDSKGEVSRFLQQLKYDAKLPMTTQNINPPVQIKTASPITMDKNHSLEILKSYLEEKDGFQRKLSPSSINLYQMCQLRFYYRYIAKIRETEEILEEIDPAMFGNILHQAMNVLYDPFTGKKVLAADINTVLNSSELLNQALDKAFAEELFNGNENTDYSGRELIVKEVILDYMKQILRNDMAYAPFEIYSLETNYDVYIPIKHEQLNGQVKIAGNIDRVDIKDGKYRVIDYKTGKAKLSFSSLEELFADDHKKHNKAALQTFLYAEMLQQSVPNELRIQPGLFVNENLFKSPFKWELYDSANKRVVNDYSEYREDFMELLNQKVNDIFNPVISFTQTDDAKTCENCPYKMLCGK